MLKDTLHLSPPPELFLERSLDDLAFIGGILDELVKELVENSGQSEGSSESDYISDTEWQFSQLLTQYSLESSPFIAHAYPEIIQKITALRESSNSRRKSIEETGLSLEIAQAEPVVSSAELNGLLGSA